ncbi:MAG TPA: preprotein translocase subunit YajC [Gaiellaceae bacterium]|nr:preprotein translocase subunit YajC [Gaiellaceae bacterium]
MNSGFFVLILLVLFVVWLLMVRPQRRRRQAQEAMIDSLQPGDEVLTAGGLFAHVVRVFEDEVTVELSPGVEARLAKRAVAAVIPREENADEQAVSEPSGAARR